MAIRWGAVARGEVGVRRGGGDDVARRGNAVQPPTFSRRSTEAHLSLRFLSEIWRSSEEGKGQGRRVPGFALTGSSRPLSSDGGR